MRVKRVISDPFFRLSFYLCRSLSPAAQEISAQLCRFPSFQHMLPMSNVAFRAVIHSICCLLYIDLKYIVCFSSQLRTLLLYPADDFFKKVYFENGPYKQSSREDRGQYRKAALHSCGKRSHIQADLRLNCSRSYFSHPLIFSPSEELLPSMRQ